MTLLTAPPVIIAQVRKRDGRVVAFDEAKIADAIFRAAVSVGGEDRMLAEELAGVVRVLLEREFRDRIPGIEDVQDSVEKVLIETGHAKTAKAYILYRNQRARVRENLAVERDGGAAGGPRVESASRAEIRPWNKARIATALVAEADLPREQAEEIAREVEDRVFRAGLQRVSTSLLRALVDNVLFEKGLAARLARQRAVGLPKFDVQEILRGKDPDAAGRGAPVPAARPADARRAAGRIADAVLASHNLEEAFSPEIANAHREGRIDLGRISSVAPARVRTIPLRALLAPEAGSAWERAPRAPGDLAGVLRAILDEAAVLAGAALRVAVLPALDAFLGPWAEASERRDVSRFAAGLLEGLERIARLGGPRAEIHLAASIPEALRGLPARGTSGAPLPKPYGACEEGARQIAKAILAAFGERNPAERSLLAPRIAFRVGQDDLARPEGLEVVEYAAVIAEDNGGPLFLLPPLRSGFLPGLPSPPGEGFPLWDRAVAAAEPVTVNLPLAAREAAGEEGRLYEILEGLVSLAVRAQEERRAFLRGLGVANRLPAAAAEALPVRLAGLPECAAAVGAGGSEVARAARILAFLSAQAKAEAERRDLPVLLLPGEDPSVAARFAAAGAPGAVSLGILRERDPAWLAAAPRLAPFVGEGPVRRLRPPADAVDREILQGTIAESLRAGGIGALVVLPEGGVCHGCRDFVPEGRACPRCGAGAVTAVPEMEVA